MRFKIDMKKELKQAWINVLKIEPEKTVRLTARQANDIALEYEKILCLTDVVKCNCKTPRPQMKVSENGISGYCANCAEPWQ
jgi:hypothetical protein